VGLVRFAPVFLKLLWEMNTMPGNAERIEKLARELQTLRILEMLKDCESLEEAIEKLKALTENS
jgi:hypothetical protein